jgi:hypothetical protein
MAKKELAFDFCLYASSLALAAMLCQEPVILTVCYAAISIIVLRKWHAQSDLCFYFVVFFLGPAGELFATYGGVYPYSKPFCLIPI